VVSTQEKTEKVKKILKGLAKVKKAQKEAVKKRKIRKYIKLTGKAIRTSLWVTPLIIGLINPAAAAAEVEDDDCEGDVDISYELEILGDIDPEILESVNELFDEFDALGNFLDDEVLDSIVDQIDPTELDIEDINVAEEMVDSLCADLETAGF